MDKMKVMGFHHPLSTILIDDHIPNRHPKMSSHLHQKMSIGCRNDYTEAFGAVYWAKNLRRMRVKNGNLRKSKNSHFILCQEL